MFWKERRERLRQSDQFLTPHELDHDRYEEMRSRVGFYRAGRNVTLPLSLLFGFNAYTDFTIGNETMGKIQTGVAVALFGTFIILQTLNRRGRRNMYRLWSRIERHPDHTPPEYN
ncbi:hypothetical protein A3G67_03880 [Candidatus Roizmanbacteria bacterium RIFCSPLOWO2_12_FULL_40_12]|uniref:Uncharacterized protein n=1 Tax=Candidatus Roizmanbacteria bacterium RIFCSPLOWO2_01_FULL_40_42 TaxID=1802066 RepID=A0A1F7J5S1_9BACT|nr:MAG: hypothetical protein A2779_03515 [Candidatus Roizmanbacteria bacterium RIFCSPHIGHO2_01_FULL_40_98]OGK28403.1 MAG: hypothetical protein A3C31_00880 [Candidatus Roizmanbacteria bacterium RIFCSPHIGHO2_02_FULL_40_53]OGK30639.1 MAG: hypothetical protein A2W49_03565 [Candidatus Roizmanbacteria bacterium RIFCSPHIGHO2_12_41_18]OGK35967.1 MAG: hypothetical protein A3E69_03250 [Candidatus Roizmanbacteria bacterium RIFCSPHIGHO2_12_FULL_40_130]OGK50959.1 MAG: hypothetical protein A3B50_01650 [Candi